MIFKEYYLVFTNGDGYHTWFTKKGFGHISLICRCQNTILLMEPKYKGCKIEVVDSIKIDRILSYLTRTYDAKLIKVVRNDDIIKSGFLRQLNYLLPSILNCTKFCKYVLGINIRGFSPYSIYKFMCNIKKMPQGIESIEVL